jgi:hypothetical protein
MSITITVQVPRTNSLISLMEKFSKRIKDRSDQSLAKEAQVFREEIIAGWPVGTGGGVDTVRSRDAWSLPSKTGEGVYRLVNRMPYAATIEYGGYPNPGPKTERQGSRILPGGIEVDGGVFPTQKPAAPVRQAMSKRRLAWASGKGLGVK